ncbi:hypothetical protein V8C86DRAFT_2804862, partial [Haematococcus lacustris]
MQAGMWSGADLVVLVLLRCTEWSVPMEPLLGHLVISFTSITCHGQMVNSDTIPALMSNDTAMAKRNMIPAAAAFDACLLHVCSEVYNVVMCACTAERFAQFTGVNATRPQRVPSAEAASHGSASSSGFSSRRSTAGCWVAHRTSCSD